MWSLDNYGSTLIALIFNGPCFQWDSTATSATSTRATIISNAPTASRDMLVSTPDRHLVFFGTETTIGDTTTQDDMFIRFSSQEDITDYTPTAINTAGTQRLADGSKIMGSLRGRDATLYLDRHRHVYHAFCWVLRLPLLTNKWEPTVDSLAKTHRVEVDGAAYWMSDNGFFRYTGQLESMDCLVEDYVYDDINSDV